MTLSDSGFSCSVEALALAQEDPAELGQLYSEWMTAYPCTDPIERCSIEQALTALSEKRRSERLRATLRTDRCRTAELFFEREQEEDRLNVVLPMFNQNCGYAMCHLIRTAAGCRWAIAEWEGLEKKLAEEGTWYGMGRVAAIQLLGVSAAIDHLFYSELAYMVSLDCLVAKANPKQADIDRLLDPVNIPKALQDRDVKLWPGNPAESRARLQAIVDRELPWLRALEASLRVQYEDPARAEAREMALVNLTREELPLLKAEKMHEQSYARAVAAYMKVRKQNATSRRTRGCRRGQWRGTSRPRTGGSGLGVGEREGTPVIGPSRSCPASVLWPSPPHPSLYHHGRRDSFGEGVVGEGAPDPEPLTPKPGQPRATARGSALQIFDNSEYS